MVRGCPHSGYFGHGAFHTAYRYESLEPEATKAKYLAIYETDNIDPAKALEELGTLRDWQERGRMFDGTDPVSILTARRIWPMDWRWKYSRHIALPSSGNSRQCRTTT